MNPAVGLVAWQRNALTVSRDLDVSGHVTAQSLVTWHCQSIPGAGEKFPQVSFVIRRPRPLVWINCCQRPSGNWNQSFSEEFRRQLFQIAKMHVLVEMHKLAVGPYMLLGTTCFVCFRLKQKKNVACFMTSTLYLKKKKKIFAQTTIHCVASELIPFEVLWAGEG